MKQYNNKYKNVFYENKNWRLYDENCTNSYDSLFSETQIKLIELIETFNFKIFYFTCKPATENKLIINDGYIDLTGNDIKKIKSNQSEDFFYFYKNQICEVFYSFLKLDNNNYYFDFMLVVNQNFDLNSVYNYNFKSIKIESIKEIHLNEISFEWVQSIFEKRVVTYNNCVPIQDKDYYDLSSLEYGYENYAKDFKNNLMDFEHDEYLNFDSFLYYKKFDQNKYATKVFKLLSSHIWSLDYRFYKEKNKYGYRIEYKETFDLNSPFLTNFAELVGCFSLTFNNNEVNTNKKHYTYCCLLDNLMDQGITLNGFNIEYLKNKPINFDNLKIINKYE